MVTRPGEVREAVHVHFEGGLNDVADLRRERMFFVPVGDVYVVDQGLAHNLVVVREWALGTPVS